MTHVPWLVESLSLFGLSLAATVIALRGRRVGDHSYCRRCGFDLFGKPPESSVCSECGADLARRKSIRVGRRERCGRVLAVAVPVMLLSATWSGWDVWRQARAVDWNSHKPAWWLVREANGRNPAARDAALVELARRIGDGRLPRDRRDALVNRALDIQADQSRPWTPGWGTIVEAAHDTGGLAAEQWQRYMVRALTLVLEPMQSPVRRCDPLFFRLRPGPDRVGAVTVTRGQAVEALRIGIYAAGPVTIDGRAVEVDERIARFYRGDADLSVEMALPPPLGSADTPLFSWATFAGPLRTGRQTASGRIIRLTGTVPGWIPDGRRTARMKLLVLPLRSVRSDSGSYSYAPAGPGRSVEVETACPIVPTARVNADPAFRTAIERAITVERLAYRPNDPRRLDGVLRFGDVPIAFACKVFISRGEQRIQAASLCVVPGGYRRTFDLHVFFQSGGDAPATIDLEFQPEPILASPDVTEIWGGVVTLRDVPVAEGGAALAAPRGPR
jgi:hypothetical protein